MREEIANPGQHRVVEEEIVRIQPADDIAGGDIESFVDGVRLSLVAVARIADARITKSTSSRPTDVSAEASSGK